MTSTLKAFINKDLSTLGHVKVVWRLPKEAEELLKSSLYNQGRGDNLHAEQSYIILMVSILPID